MLEITIVGADNCHIRTFLRLTLFGMNGTPMNAVRRSEDEHALSEAHALHQAVIDGERSRYATTVMEVDKERAHRIIDALNIGFEASKEFAERFGYEGFSGSPAARELRDALRAAL